MEATPMPNSLPELEAERSQILRQFTPLGDLRRGSICAVPRRCGKPTCHCAKPNDPGHDPQIRLTRKVEGRTVAESFPSPAAWRKAQSEIDEHHRFQKLSTELIAVNEKICIQRPLESESSTWTREKKNGCCDPCGDHPRSRSVAARALQRPAQDGECGPGSQRNDDALGHASGRSRRDHSTTAGPVRQEMERVRQLTRPAASYRGRVPATRPGARDA